MTKERILKRVMTELTEGLRLSTEAIQTGSYTFRRLALPSFQRAREASEEMLTEGEKEFVDDLCAYVEAYLEMRLPEEKTWSP